MCEKLESRGVKVFLLTDCNRKQFDETEKEYVRWLATHPNALAFLYFAGHAVEHNNHNWLLLRSEAGKQRKISKDSICLTTFIARYVKIVLKQRLVKHRPFYVMCVRVSRLQLLKVQAIFAVLDCCREFKEHDVIKSTTRGRNHLAVGSMNFSSTTIAYATGPNGIALDGTGKHGK